MTDTSHGPYIDDIYLPNDTVSFLPAGGFVGSGTVDGYRYVSVRDEDGVERDLAVYFIGPDGHGYRVRQGVEYGEGDPLDPDTERIPCSLESEVDDLGPVDDSQLETVMRSDHPGLTRD